MADNRYQRDRVTGRFVKMTPDDLVPENVSATDVRPGMEVPRHAPTTDDLAQGGQWPVMRRRPVLVPAEEHPETIYAGRYGEVSRAAARRSPGPVDPSAWLTGADDGLTPEARAAFLARQQAPAQVRRVGDE